MTCGRGGAALAPQDEVGSVFDSGTLGIGFIGGHNAMMALYGEGHGRSDRSWQTLYDAVQVINEVVREYKQKYHLNYSVLATPAEGLSGRFTRMDRKRYGIIPGVNDLDYYVNSFHVDVREEIGMHDKIRREAPLPCDHARWAYQLYRARRRGEEECLRHPQARQDNEGYGYRLRLDQPPRRYVSGLRLSWDHLR